MSEFMEKHSISRLIGSPPGYVGYENGGELTDNVRRNPYSIVLFDEAEKAHPDVLNILLQILEDGRLTDSQKRLISFENTIIVLTSNAAAGEIQNILTKKEMLENGLTDKSNNENSTTFIKEIIQETISYGALNFLKSPISFNYNDDLRKKLHNILNYSLSYYKNTKENTINTKSLKSLVIEKLSAIFLPEFINRFDDIIIFRPLTVEQLRKISIIMIDKVIQKAKIKNVNLIVEDNVKLKLARDAYNPIFGARPLRRAITKNVEDRVSEVLLSYNSKNEKIAIKFSLSSLGEINITHYLE
jgi:ATP-dependent Clp protease ATP-binding subunit ClpC